MGHWFVDGHQLRLNLRGNIISPSANEVFRSVREGETVWPEVPPGQAEELRNLVFSPFLILPRAAIQWNADRNELVLALEFSSQTGLIACGDVCALETGHLIFQDTWMPVDSSLRHELLSSLQDTGLNFGPIQSLKQYLLLRKLVGEKEHLFRLNYKGDEIPEGHFLPSDLGVPSGICANLYDYQLSGWRWLKYVVSEGVGGILADEMGLGKTLQIISLLADAGKYTPFPALIVAPGSLLENWIREFKKFAPQLNVLKHAGSQRTGSPAELARHDVIVCSYETVSTDNALMLMSEWSIVVIDEAQNIKNPAAKRTRSLKNLARRSAIAVTGTPVENSLTDLWSIFDFLLPGFLGDQKLYERKYGSSVAGAERLEQQVSPLILRRLVMDVATDLPSRIDIPQFIELSEDEACSYEAIRNSALEEVGNGAVLASLTSLRMFCCHPSLTGAASPTPYFSKTQRLLEILDEIFSSSEKVLIFCSYVGAADLIVELVRKEFGIFCEALDGRVVIEDRQQRIDLFSAIYGSACLVLNPKVAGAGLNITAANHVVHYNPEWNPAVEDQASARAHRRGQTRPVTIHRLMLVNTVEEVVVERLTKKRNLAGAAIVGVAGDDDDYAEIIAALHRSPFQE